MSPPQVNMSWHLLILALYGQVPSVGRRSKGCN